MMYMEEKTVKQVDEIMSHLMHTEIILTGSSRKRPFELVDFKAVKKCKEDDSAYLPDPFSLPTNFRPDIEVCLKSGKKVRLARASFLSTVAGAMFQYKKIPK